MSREQAKTFECLTISHGWSPRLQEPPNMLREHRPTFSLELIRLLGSGLGRTLHSHIRRSRCTSAPAGFFFHGCTCQGSTVGVVMPYEMPSCLRQSSACP
ncbi:hypothetical protein CCHR01_15892 [Colletotrichum chrysophilum]|uniref:Uncharacterized protein n=1 Tax=Colletotrichum chrysophilum TaxID=1836956 RepID=A0AAD9E894_9PEZI|nr:hypothetical protein CCHR01_15892 [Colletotrichum chrysophilum]